MSVKWGILGAGNIARTRVMPSMNRCRACEIQALMVRDLDRAAKLAKEFGARRHYDTVDKLLADPDVDAIYVSSPVYLHTAHVISAAEHKKHIFCDKPMAMNSDECREMIEACDQAGVILEICLVLRGWPIYQRVKEILDSGRLGTLIELRAHLAKWTERKEGMWRLDPARGGGGFLMDVGSHYLDLFRYLHGEFARIAYMGSSAIFNREVEESGFVLVEFTSGAHGMLGVTHAVPCSGYILEVYGTEGTLLLGDDLTVKTKGTEEVLPAKFPDYYDGILAHFCQRVLEDRGPMASGYDGLKNIEAIETAYRSEKEGRILELPE